MHLQWLRDFITTPMRGHLVFPGEGEPQKCALGRLGSHSRPPGRSPAWSVGEELAASVGPPLLVLRSGRRTAMAQSERGKTTVTALRIWPLGRARSPAPLSRMSQLQGRLLPRSSTPSCARQIADGQTGWPRGLVRLYQTQSPGLDTLLRHSFPSFRRNTRLVEAADSDSVNPGRPETLHF